MRVAIVKRHCSLRRGGSERYCVNLSRALMARGVSVTVMGESIDEDLVGEISFIRVPVRQWHSTVRNRSFAENSREVAERESFDVVYGLGRVYGADAIRVTERIQSHWIRVRYSALAQTWQRCNPRHRTLIQLERDILGAESTRRVVCQSRLDRELVSRYYDVDPRRLSTIYNGVDTSTFQRGVRGERNRIRRELNIPSDAPLLVFASMDFAGKGLWTIFRAMATCRRPYWLLVLGSGPIRRARSTCERLGIGDRVIFAGRRQDVADCYGAGDLFVLPTAYEPFPNVNLEAMACGLPVITTKTAGGADIIEPGSNGYLLSEMNADAELTDILNRHPLDSVESRQQWADRCWQVASRFTIDRNVDETLRMFREIHDEKLCA